MPRLVNAHFSVPTELGQYGTRFGTKLENSLTQNNQLEELSIISDECMINNIIKFLTRNKTLKKLTLSGSKDEAKLYNLQNFISLATALTPETWKSELDKVMLKKQSLVYAEIFKYIKEGKTLIEASKLVEAEPSTFENLMFKQYSTNTTLETLELKNIRSMK